MIHQPLSPDGVHPQIISSLRLLVLCLFRPEWFVINYCLFIFFKELVSFIGSLDKCHTSVFNALIVTGDSARYRTKPILSYAWFFNVLREQHRRSGPRFNVGFCPCRTCVSGFLTLVLTQLFFPKPPTTFLTCFCSGERRKYAGKKVRLNRGSNSQPPGHDSDTLTTEPPRQGSV